MADTTAREEAYREWALRLVEALGINPGTILADPPPVIRNGHLEYTKITRDLGRYPTYQATRAPIPDTIDPALLRAPHTHGEIVTLNRDDLARVIAEHATCGIALHPGPDEITEGPTTCGMPIPDPTGQEFTPTHLADAVIAHLRGEA